MRKFSPFILFSVLLSLGISGHSWSNSDDFYKSEKGIKALKDGNYKVALKELTPIAKEGNKYAQGALGRMYYYGDGVQKDLKTALKWTTSAAEQGEINAQNHLGVMYLLGEGVATDYSLAEFWFRLSAKRGVATAQHNLGSMYQSGLGVRQSYIYAYMWYNLSAHSQDVLSHDARDQLEKIMSKKDLSKAQELSTACSNRGVFETCFWGWFDEPIL